MNEKPHTVKSYEDQLKKLNNFNKSLLEYSKDTVTKFYKDARDSGYHF